MLNGIFKKIGIWAMLIIPSPGLISSHFGPRVDPILHRPSFHSGIDIAGLCTTKVSATFEGMVSFAGTRSGYGRVVIVEHEEKLETYYAHLGRMFVKKGDHVSRGQIVGWMGLTGRSTGCHAHYEVRKNGIAMDPLKYSFRANKNELVRSNMPLQEFWAVIFGPIERYF